MTEKPYISEDFSLLYGEFSEMVNELWRVVVNSGDFEEPLKIGTAITCLTAMVAAVRNPEWADDLIEQFESHFIEADRKSWEDLCINAQSMVTYLPTQKEETSNGD